jgi:hypothetical protein
MNQWDILAAGQYVLKVNTERSLKDASQNLTQLVQGLGNLAPKGSRDQEHESGVRHAVSVVKQILSSPLAVLKGQQKVYAGEHYQAIGDPQQITLTSQDGRGEILKVSQTSEGQVQIQSRMMPKDTGQIGRFGQAFQAFQQTAKTAATKVGQFSPSR